MKCRRRKAGKPPPDGAPKATPRRELRGGTGSGGDLISMPETKKEEA